MVTDINFLVVQQHAIDSLNCSVCGFSSLVMDEAEATRVTVLIGCNFARKNITESGKCVMQCLRF